MSKRLQLRKLAIAQNNDTFIWDCARHGASIHDTHLGSCTLCHTKLVTLSPRLRALNTGALFYPDTCGEHGAVDFHTRRALCTLCFDSRGRNLAGRFARLSDRARARRAGEKTYMGVCKRHGDTAHSVPFGKCLLCYTTLGHPRKFMRTPMPPLP